MIHYANDVFVGIAGAFSKGDGSSIAIKWFRACSDIVGYKIAYNIYLSTDKDKVYSEGAKFVYIEDHTDTTIINLDPGQDYFFSIRPVEYNPNIFNPNNLPIAYANLRYYPESLLRQNINITDLIIPLIDISDFTSYGIIEIGSELIQYSSIDHLNSNLIVEQRGYKSSTISIHNIDGYNGSYYDNPKVKTYLYKEYIEFDRIYVCQCRFEYPNNAVTEVDGYKQVLTDYLTIDLSASDKDNQNFPTYPYCGYHRISPAQLFSGTCIGSYIGGERNCIDSHGASRVVRGFSLQDSNNQRQEMLLNVIGRPAVLIKRQRTGVLCSCYLASSEVADDRCPKCFGQKFVLGYEQFFDPRRSDGRIMIRVSPTDDDLKPYESGLESESQPDAWTLTVPTIKDRDILVLFDEADREEFRYEVLHVNRNNTMFGMMGCQKLKLQRIRKFDVAYQIKIFANTSKYPSTINTGIGSVSGLIAPHVHAIQTNEDKVNNFSQVTSINAGHDHVVNFKNGQLVVVEALGHTHSIVL